MPQCASVFLQFGQISNFVSVNGETKEIVSIHMYCDLLYLASPEALEVIVDTDSLTNLLSVSTDLTDVTLVSDDTYRRLD